MPFVLYNDLIHTKGLMPELSPETQKIVNAAVDVTGYGKETPLLKLRIAAALRAAALAVYEKHRYGKLFMEEINAIADELEQS